MPMTWRSYGTSYGTHAEGDTNDATRAVIFVRSHPKRYQASVVLSDLNYVTIGNFRTLEEAKAAVEVILPLYRTFTE